jgi:ATP-dependent RNA helicase RhlE
VTPVASTAERVEQKLIFIEQVAQARRAGALLREPGVAVRSSSRRTKHGAGQGGEEPRADGIAANAIHGNKSQGSVSARWPTSSPAARRCLSRPTSPPAASTSTA